MTAKAAAAPAAATIMPPMAGPTLRARLKPMEFRVTAPARSSRGTMSPTDACQAGPLKATPQPIRKVKASSTQGVIHPIQVIAANPVETSSMKVWAASMILRRSTVSASAPAASDSSMIGRVTDACTRAVIWAEAMEVIIQAAPTDWISPPKLVTRLVIHTARKIGCFSGARAEGRAGGGEEGGVAASALELMRGASSHGRSGVRGNRRRP
ncbi:hypothetical protein D3C80_866630 [compost metagenome]